MIFRPRRTSGRPLILAALLLAIAFLPPVVLHAALPALSPFLGLSALTATRADDVTLFLTLPMTALVLWRRRFFCRFMCPMGWITETCGKSRPDARRNYARVPRLGQWAALLTLGGALLGFPLFLFLDPLVILTGAGGASRMAGTLAYWAYATAFGIVVIISFGLPGLWCARLCPLGGLQDLMADAKTLATKRRSTANAGSGAAPPVARRAFIGITGGAATALLAPRLSLAADDRQTPLRPPGAVDEATLRTLCARCGSCVRACPARIIRPDLAPPGLTGLLVPSVSFEQGHCLDDCARCGEACPTGAIAHLSLAEKNQRRIGLAHIDPEACLLTLQRDCSVCTLVCPRQAITEEFSKKTYSLAVHVHKSRCTGCGACVAACPPRAITVKPG